MSMRYEGGIISATPPTVTNASAKGVWTLNEQAKYKQQGLWPEALPPTTIGQAYGGGFYAGKIAVGGGGVATHYLIVAPKATGEATKPWGSYGATGLTSSIDGPANSAALAARGAAYQAAVFCEGLTIGGYSDWYLPARNELEVLYYFLKPTTQANEPSYGANVNAVLPEPINTNYTSGSPAQTSAVGFKDGEVNAFVNGGYYWSSTDYTAGDAWIRIFSNGGMTSVTKTNSTVFRAVRRIPI